MKPQASISELGIVLFSFVLICVITASFQARTTMNDGQGWDGAHYYAMARSIQAGDPIAAPSPYVRRPGVPWLAAMTSSPASLLEGFLRVSVAANAVLVVVLALWLSLWVDRVWIRVLVNLVFQAHWLGPVRHVWYYPTYIDPAAMALSVVFLLLAFTWPDKRPGQPLVLAGLAMIGVTLRENLIVLPLSLLAFDWAGLQPSNGWATLGAHAKKVLDVALVPVTAGLFGLALVHSVTTSTVPSSYLGTLIQVLFHKSPVAWLYAAFIMYGPLLALPFYDARGSLRFLSRQPVLLAYGVMGAVLSFIGGADTERFFGWMFPLMLILIGRSMAALESRLRKPLVWVPLIVGQVLALRLFWQTPDGAPCAKGAVLVWLTRIGECVSQADLYSTHASPAARATGMWQYALWVAVLFAALWWTGRSGDVAAPFGSRSADQHAPERGSSG